ncbi:hypothetical protein D3C84_963650 [compost metagenome]
MRGAAIGDLRFPEQREVVQRVEPAPEVADGEVEVTVDDLLFEEGRRQLGELEVQPLVAGPQARDGQGDLLVGQRVDLAEQTDVEGARQGAVDVLDLEAESFGGGQQSPGGLEELTALLREGEAGAAAMA